MVIYSEDDTDKVHVSDDAGEEYIFDLPLGKVANIQIGENEKAIIIERNADHSLSVSIDKEVCNSAPRMVSNEDIN